MSDRGVTCFAHPDTDELIPVRDITPALYRRLLIAEADARRQMELSEVSQERLIRNGSTVAR